MEVKKDMLNAAEKRTLHSFDELGATINDDAQAGTAGTEDTSEFDSLRSALHKSSSGRTPAKPAAPDVAPKAKKSTQRLDRESDVVPFSLKSVQDSDWSSFAASWRPTMQTPTYIGETEMLLQYLHSMEVLYKVTMPIKACGIDPVVFQNVEPFADATGNNDTGPHANSVIFAIPDKDESGNVTESSAYELIEVDGDLYMSCTSRVLDPTYMTSVISTITSAIKENGQYVFQMVGYRQLALVEGETEGRLLNTLKLNTYEMSLLCAYMKQFRDMKVSFGEMDGKQCILFSLK